MGAVFLHFTSSLFLPLVHSSPERNESNPTPPDASRSSRFSPKTPVAYAAIPDRIGNPFSFLSTALLSPNYGRDKRKGRTKNISTQKRIPPPTIPERKQSTHVHPSCHNPRKREEGVKKNAGMTIYQSSGKENREALEREKASRSTYIAPPPPSPCKKK